MRARHRRLEPLVERAPVRQLRERVLVREPLELGEQLRAADGGGHLRRTAPRRSAGGRRAGRRRRAWRTRRAAPRRGRRRRSAPRPSTPCRAPRAPRARRRAGPARRARRRTSAPRGAAACRAPVRRQVSSAGRGASIGAQIADVHERAEHLPRRLPATDGDARRAQHAARLLGDDLQHVLEPVRTGDRPRDLDQRAQLRLQRAVGPDLRQPDRPPARARAARRPRRCRARAAARAVAIGQNCVPALRSSSARAASAPSARAVRAVGGHRVPGVADEADAARERDRPRRRARPGSPCRPSARAPPAWRGARWASEPIAPTMRAPIAGCWRMTSHSGAVSRAVLLQDRVRHADLADVVQQRDLADRAELGLPELELGADRQGELDARPPSARRCSSRAR